MTSLSPQNAAGSADRQNALGRSLTSPEALALLTTWVENPSHLQSRLTRFGDGLEEAELRERLRTVSKLWNAYPGHPLSSSQYPRNGGGLSFRELETADDTIDPKLKRGNSPLGEVVLRSAWPYSGTVPPSDNCVEHLRHPGVEKLLTEYYKMVEAAKVDMGERAVSKLELKQQLVRWVCPQPPEFLELYSITKKCRIALAFLAACTMYLIPLLLPAWLYVLRHLLSSDPSSWGSVILTAAVGITIFKVAESVDYERKQDREKGPGAKIQAFRIPANGKMPLEAEGLLAAVAKCNGVGKSVGSLTASRGVGGGEYRTWDQCRCNDSRHNGVAHAGSASKVFHASAAGPEVRDLLQDIKTVRTAVLGVQGGNEVENDCELVELQRQVKMLCEAVGVPYSSGRLASVTALRNKLHEVKSVVGC